MNDHTFSEVYFGSLKWELQKWKTGTLVPHTKKLTSDPSNYSLNQPLLNTISDSLQFSIFSSYNSEM